MVWIMLATLVVVFVVGFRILTSDSRRAIQTTERTLRDYARSAGVDD
ncbi:DUF1198 family protein [Lelliottia nimipressuralis]